MEKNEESLKKNDEPMEENEKSPGEEENPPEKDEKAPEEEEKPLEKMTAKELREIALEIPEIEGVHAMKKEALLEAIIKSRGVEKEEAKEEKKEAKKKEKKEVEKKAGVGVAELKKRIREFKVLKAEAVEKGDARTARIYRRRINRLKKRTRKAA